MSCNQYPNFVWKSIIWSIYKKKKIGRVKIILNRLYINHLEMKKKKKQTILICPRKYLCKQSTFNKLN